MKLDAITSHFSQMSHSEQIEFIIGVRTRKHVIKPAKAKHEKKERARSIKKKTTSVKNLMEKMSDKDKQDLLDLLMEDEDE